MAAKSFSFVTQILGLVKEEWTFNFLVKSLRIVNVNPTVEKVVRKRHETHETKGMQIRFFGFEILMQFRIDLNPIPGSIIMGIAPR